MITGIDDPSTAGAKEPSAVVTGTTPKETAVLDGAERMARQQVNPITPAVINNREFMRSLLVVSIVIQLGPASTVRHDDNPRK